MNMLKNNKKFICAILLVAALVFSIFFEVAVFMREATYEFDSEAFSMLDEEICGIDVIGYDVNENTYTQTSEDAQLIFSGIDKDIKTLVVTFTHNLRSSVDYQVYYSADGTEFSEENSTGVCTIPIGANSFLVTIPEASYNTIRIDINGSFTLDDVRASNGFAAVIRRFNEPFNLLRVVTMFAIMAAVILLFLRWLWAEKSNRRINGAELAFCLVCFGFYAVWAAAKGFNYAPDEAMRYDVTKFFFENNRLPIKDELLSDWGFSYAHLPAMLCSYFGYILMKITSVFTLDGNMLLFAARMVSVICSTGAIYFIIKISKLLFKSPARWIMIVTVAFMPQYAFLASYVNNDSVAFLGITMIVYAWVLAMSDNWSFKNASLLSGGIAICAASYYNSYAWILLSIFFFCITYFYKNPKDYKGFAKFTGFIIGLTFLLAGYCFVRHLVIYGDLLGFETSHYYGELYAIDSLKPSTRISVAEHEGISLMDMLFDMNWLEITSKSFIGNFGYMRFPCPDYVYTAAGLFFAIGFAGLIVKVVSDFIKKRKPEALKATFYACVVLCAVITICLSIYNSYNTDFQPQGRYCYPAFLSIALLVAVGYDKVSHLFKKNVHRYAFIATICATFISFSYFVFRTVYLPS